MLTVEVLLHYFLYFRFACQTMESRTKYAAETLSVDLVTRFTVGRVTTNEEKDVSV